MHEQQSLQIGFYVAGGRSVPLKSKKQMRYLFAAEERGDVPKGTAKHFVEKTPSIKRLPETAPKPKKKRRK